MQPVSAVQVDVSIGWSSSEMNRDASSGVYGYRIGSRYGLPKENFQNNSYFRTDSQLKLNLDEELHKTYDPNIEK
jgi:hypothetical protein